MAKEQAAQAISNAAKPQDAKKVNAQQTAVKSTNGSIQDNDANRYINEEFAKTPFQFEPENFDNGQQYQINIFFAPKFLFDKEKNYFSEENYTFLKYNENVKSIVIEDKLAHFGISGYIDVVNTGEYLNFILDRLNCYYLVINFRLVENENFGIRFEPYILDVTSVTNYVDKNAKENKQILRLNFVDMFSYIAMQHSMASVLKFDPSINKKGSYRQVFKVIMDYFKRFIKVNYDGIYSVKKDILFSYDNQGASANVEALVENSFRKMDPTCTIYEGMEILLRDAGAPIKSSKGFKEKYNDFDYMLVPLFFKEEYQDLYGVYQTIFDPKPYKSVKNASSNAKGISNFFSKIITPTAKTAAFLDSALGAKEGETTVSQSLGKVGMKVDINSSLPISQLTEENSTFFKNFNGTNDCIMMRTCSLRDIHMPFTLCFNKDGNIIYESINPTKNEKGEYTEKENSFHCMNGRHELGIANYLYYPTNQNLVQKLWKNMILCNTGQQDGQASTVLIEFNWIYQYYIYNFLGYGTGRDEGYTSNVTPSFFLALQNQRITDESVMADFSEMNANFQIIRSTSDLNEALIYIGKNLTSFVTQNDTYQFRIRGDLFRHPNEIMKVSNTNDQKSNPAVAIHTDLANNDYILMYTTSVKHTWEGVHYTNDISANKIYERLVNDTGKG